MYIMDEFNFSEWVSLAKDPEAFNKRKDDVLREFIESAPEKYKQKLGYTLFKINAADARSKSALQSSIESSKLMWESFHKLKHELDLFTIESKKLSEESNPTKDVSNVVSVDFKSKKK